MKKLLLLSTILIFACQSPTKVSKEEVMESFETFFEVLDRDLNNFDAVVTDDFFIYENSRHYTKAEFIDFVKNIPPACLFHPAHVLVLVLHIY